MNDLKENSFQHRIEKEEVNKMPLTAFEGEIIVVRTKMGLWKAMRYLNKQTCVGVDTETRPAFEHGQHFPTALVQIATLEKCFLFQLRHIGFPKMLADFFANPGICKVGLAFRDDLTGLKRLRYFEPHNCLDVQKMVVKYGILDLGLQKIFAIIFGKKISKSQQLTNWDIPTLTAEQARYASTDAWATLMIYKELLNTQMLPTDQVEALCQADKQRLIEHQQQVLAQRNGEN